MQLLNSMSTRSSHGVRVLAEEDEVAVLAKQVPFGLCRLELLAGHDEVTAEVASCNHFETHQLGFHNISLFITLKYILCSFYKMICINNDMLMLF